MGLCWAATAVAMVAVICRLLGRVTTDVVVTTSEALYGPRVVAQPEPVEVPQPEPGESMFPPWEEEPWSLDVDEPLSRPEG